MFKKISRVIPLALLLSGIITLPALAQDDKPKDKPAPAKVIEKALKEQEKAGYAKVDYSKVDLDPQAPAMEGLYPVDPHTFIQAECGGKYLTDDCWVRRGVSVPPNVVFTAEDKDGKPTYKGVPPPTAEEMKNIPVSTYPASKDAYYPDPKIKAYYGQWNHDQQGWTLPWIYPHAGIYASNSSPNWTMPGQGQYWDYFIWQVMYPGDGCLEAGMIHNRVLGAVTHSHGYNNHCAQATPNYAQDTWILLENHNSAWSTTYERMNMGGMSYLEYLWVYIKTGSTTPATKSCTQATLYNWSVGAWEQKANVCGWQNQYSVGDAWDLVEEINIWNWESSRWQCEFNPVYPLMSNSVYFYNINNQWQGIINSASVTNSIQPYCGSWNLGGTWDPYGIAGWIKY